MGRVPLRVPVPTFELGARSSPHRIASHRSPFRPVSIKERWRRTWGKQRIFRSRSTLQRNLCEPSTQKASARRENAIGIERVQSSSPKARESPKTPQRSKNTATMPSTHPKHRWNAGYIAPMSGTTWQSMACKVLRFRVGAWVGVGCAPSADAAAGCAAADVSSLPNVLFHGGTGSSC